MKRERNKEVIEKYQTNLSLREVGEIYGLSRQRVHQILVRHGIETRRYTESDKMRKSREAQMIPKQTLENLYLGQNLPVSKIAKLFSVSRKCIKTLLATHNIPIRSHEEQLEISRPRLYPRLRGITREELYSLYVEKNYTRKQLAQFYECSFLAITKRLERFGIKKQKNRKAAN